MLLSADAAGAAEYAQAHGKPGLGVYHRRHFALGAKNSVQDFWLGAHAAAHRFRKLAVDGNFNPKRYVNSRHSGSLPVDQLQQDSAADRALVFNARHELNCQ